MSQPSGYGRIEQLPNNPNLDDDIELEDVVVDEQNVIAQPLPQVPVPQPQQNQQPIYITQNGGNYPHIQQQQQQQQQQQVSQTPNGNIQYPSLQPQQQVQYVVQNNGNAVPPFQPQAVAQPYAVPVGGQQQQGAGNGVGQGYQLVAVRPPPPTPEQFRNVIKQRSVEFQFCKYQKEAWNYMKYNCCATFGIMACWILFMIVFFILAGGFAYFVDPNSGVHRIERWGDRWYYDYDYRYGYDVSDGVQPNSTYSSYSYSDYIGYPSIYWDDDWDDDYDEDDWRCGYGDGECREERERGFAIFLLVECFKAILQVTVFLPLVSGFYGAIMKSMRDNTHLKVKDTFMSFSTGYYCKLLPLSITMYVIGFVLYLLLIIPGIWWNIATLFALIIHREHMYSNTRHAIKYSIERVHRDCCSLFGFVIILAVYNILGALCLGIGLLFTIPFSTVAIIYCYHHLVGVNGVTVYVPMSAPSLHPPNAGNPSGRHVWTDAI